MSKQFSIPNQPWATPAQKLGTEAEIQSRQSRVGLNRLREAHRRSAWEILIEQFKSLVVLLLVVQPAYPFKNSLQSE